MYYPHTVHTETQPTLTLLPLDQGHNTEQEIHKQRGQHTHTEVSYCLVLATAIQYFWCADCHFIYSVSGTF